MWANVSEINGWNVPHIHSGGIWSGAYFVQATPKSGRLIFQDPRSQAHIRTPVHQVPWHKRPETWDEIHIDPTPGLFYLWPSWLRHYVEPNTEAAARISISFNVDQVFPKRISRPKVPVYVAVPKVFSDDEIQKIYQQLKDSGEWEIGQVGHQDTAVIYESYRNNQVTFADHHREEWRWVYDKIRHHAEIISREVYHVDIDGPGESIQFARYHVNEKYDEHTDVNPRRGGEQGRRSLSSVLTLKPAQRGGGTAFPRSKMEPVVQNPGDVVYFRSDEPHAALPVLEGVRDAAIIWFHRRETEQEADT